MSGWLLSSLRPLLAAALLGATLGGLGSVGLFFWENREMCPCAPVGLVDGESEVNTSTAATARRDAAIRWSALGALIGVSLAAIWVIPPALRLSRMSRDVLAD